MAGKYMNRKIGIETGMRESVDSLLEGYRRKLEANADYNDKERRERNREACDEYERAAQDKRDTAKALEAVMFDDMRRDLTAALSKAPTQDQLAYIQVLGMKSEVTASDVEQAIAALGGNAVAESALADIVARLGGGIAAESGVPDAPDLKSLLDGLGRFQESRANSIDEYGKCANGTFADELRLMCFSPSGSCKAFDGAENAIARYGD